MNNLRNLLFIQVLGTDGGINFRLRQDGPRIHGADSVDVAEGDIDALIAEEDREGFEKPNKREGYEAIYGILQNQIGHDFSGYKERSFQRRVRHRMQVLQITSLRRYVAKLREEPDEVTLLFRDLLIGVTNFFRDPGAFETLEKSVIPALFEGKGRSDTVRIWVPGCATGEEVYSLAILLREHMDTSRV